MERVFDEILKKAWTESGKHPEELISVSEEDLRQWARDKNMAIRRQTKECKSIFSLVEKPKTKKKGVKKTGHWGWFWFVILLLLSAAVSLAIVFDWVRVFPGEKCPTMVQNFVWPHGVQEGLSTEEIALLQDGYERSQEESSQLKKEIAALQEEKAGLIFSQQRLETKNADLEAALAVTPETTSDNNQLESDYGNLLAEYNKLEQKYQKVDERLKKLLSLFGVEE